MINSETTPFDQLSPEGMLEVNRICNLFEIRWQEGDRPDLDELVGECEARYRSTLIRELVPLDVEYRRQAGEAVVFDDYRDWVSIQEWENLDGNLDEPGETDFPVHDTKFEPSVPQSLGDYAIKRRIGSGGMGTVFEAEHTRMGRSVAIKILGRQVWRNAQAQARFLREIRTAAKLSHPNIVTAHDARQHEDFVYLVIEHVSGDDLQRVIQRDGPMDVARCTDCLLQAAHGLNYAHQQGIIHRDIKPANLMLDDTGVLKILDLGLARAIATDDAELTGAGVLMGTAAFMAPEQAANLQNADRRADIYALGCTMFYLLTGKVMYRGSSSVECMLQHAQSPIPSLADHCPDISSSTDRIFQKMVAKEPADRYQSMDEVIEALATLEMTSEDPAAPTIPVSPRSISDANRPHSIPRRSHASRPIGSSRRHVWWALGGLIGVGLIGAVAAQLLSDNKFDSDPSWAIGLDGNGSYIQLADPGGVPPEVTLEAIVTMRSRKSGNVVTWFRRQDSFGLGVTVDGYWWAGTTMREPNGGGGWRENLSAYGPSQIRLDRKMHVAVTFSGSRIQIFVDGIEQSMTEANDVPPLDASDGLYVGGLPRSFTDDYERLFCIDALVHAVRVSTGCRYIESFEPPEVLESDRRTLSAVDFRQGSDAFSNEPSVELVNTEWIRY